MLTGDEHHRVNLFRYPALHPGGLHQSYVGHASAVTNVRFTYNRRHAISLGGTDCTVLVWAHGLEQADSSGDDVNSVSSAGTADTATSATGAKDLKNDIGDVGARTLLQEAVNTSQPAQVIAELAKLEAPSGGDEALFSSQKPMHPWRDVIAEPTKWSPSVGCTDVDLELKWVHGYHAGSCRYVI